MRKNHDRVLINGFTLVEVLLTLSIATLCLLTLLAIYSASQRSYKTQVLLQDEASSMQLLSAYLVNKIHLVGYIGCAKLTSNFPIKSHINWQLTPSNRIVGTDTELIMQGAEAIGSAIKEISNDKQTVVVAQGIGFAEGDTVLISDCTQAEIVQVSKVVNHADDQWLQLSSALNFHYGEEAEMRKVIKNHFYFSQETSTLYQESLTHEKLTIIKQIANLHILYSVIVNNQLHDFSAVEITDWSKVSGIAVTIDLQHSLRQSTWHIYASL